MLRLYKHVQCLTDLTQLPLKAVNIVILLIKIFKKQISSCENVKRLLN